MKFTKLVFSYLFAAILAINTLYGQAQQIKFFDDQARIEQWLTENKVPALGIGIIREGKLQQVKVYGELSENILAPYNTLFNVASLTKPVVAVLTLKLVSSGQWKLDEPLANYWVDPDVVKDPKHKKLTTRHVLSHQTGFVNWRSLHPTKKLTFDHEPGTQYGYSGEGFEYLKKALEQKFNKSLEQLSDSLLFSPLGMKDTQYFWDTKTDASRFALWHDEEENNTYTDYKFTQASAADDLLTTVEDYGKFAVGVINGTILSQEIYTEMITPQTSTHKGSFFGLGWEIFTGFSNGEYMLIHTGSDKGVKTVVILLPKSRQGLVMMTNGNNGFKLAEQVLEENLTLGKEIYQKVK